MALICVDAVTVRDVAASVGMSTAIVSHYFRDKRELLLFTFGAAAESARTRLNAVLERDPADLEGVVPPAMFTAEYKAAHPVEIGHATVEEAKAGAVEAMDEEEKKQMMEQLRMLGYVE